METDIEKVTFISSALFDYCEPLISFMSKPWTKHGGTKEKSQTSRSLKRTNGQPDKKRAKIQRFTESFINLWNEQPIKQIEVIGIKQGDGSYHISTLCKNLDETIDSTVVFFRLPNRRAMLNQKQVQNELARRLMEANFEEDQPTVRF